jgi:hypothetical protein
MSKFGYGYAIGSLVAKWEEINFTLKPRSDIADVLKAFTKFYNDDNRIAGCGVTSKIYDSGTTGMLLAVSDGGTIDSITIHIKRSQGDKCIARFCVAGTSDKSTENAYQQVREFFAQRSKDLLQLGSWGVSQN